MARLRLAPVEYKICPADGIYEGEQCPHCRRPFDPQTVRKMTHDRLILVDVDPSVYERTQRCRCPACDNLYALGEGEVVAHARCTRCAASLFHHEQMRQVWKEAETLLQKARRLDRARQQVTACPHCGERVAPAGWCPLHSPSPLPFGGLPQNLTVVWVRTFNVAESLEKLHRREWLEAQEDAEERPAGGPETETDRLEGDNHAAEHDA